MNTSRISNLPFRAYGILEIFAVDGMDTAVHDYKNHNGQDAHGDADQETLQEQAEQRADIHNRRCQQRLDPIRNRFENCFHSEPPPIRKNG